VRARLHTDADLAALELHMTDEQLAKALGILHGMEVGLVAMHADVRELIAAFDRIEQTCDQGACRTVCKWPWRWRDETGMRPDFPGTPRGQPSPETTPIRPPFHRLTNCATGPASDTRMVQVLEGKGGAPDTYRTCADNAGRCPISQFPRIKYWAARSVRASRWSARPGVGMCSRGVGARSSCRSSAPRACPGSPQ
jgi:hypothetical protein